MKPKRVRVRPPEDPLIDAWDLDVKTPPGRFVVVRPEAILEILDELNEQRRVPLELPRVEDVHALRGRTPLVRKGQWEIRYRRIGMRAFQQLALRSL